MQFDLGAALRACVHKRLSTSFRQILLHTALKILAIRKYACKFLPCLQKICSKIRIYFLRTQALKKFAEDAFAGISREQAVCSRIQKERLEFAAPAEEK